MATHASPFSAASAASALLAQQTAPVGSFRPQGPDRATSPPFAGATGDPGSELTATGKSSAGAAVHPEFRTVGESVDRAGAEESGGLLLSAPLERMPVSLSVSIPVRDFRVRNLLALRSGELIETQWANGEDLPLASGAVQLAWSEFEVVDSRLAVRVTRLA